MRGAAVAWLSFSFVLAGLGGASASAQAPRDGGVVLSWVRAEGAQECPSEPELAAEVARRLGYDPFQPPFGQSLEGVVERADGRWTVVLYGRDAEGALRGRRALESEREDCAAIGDAVALAMALAIDPEAALRAPAAPPPAAEPAEPAAEDAGDAGDAGNAGATEDAAPPPAAEPEPVTSVRIAAGAVGSYDLVPTFGIGARLALDGPIVGPLRWYGAVVHWTEQAAEVGDARFGIGLTTFALGLCAGARFDWLRFDGCASVDLGGAWAVVYSPTPEAPGERFFAAATALLRLEARLLGPLGLGIFGGIAVPFVRHAYRVQGRSEVVFSPSPLAPLAGLELAVRFR